MKLGRRASRGPQRHLSSFGDADVGKVKRVRDETERRAAALAVAHHAHNEDDLAMLLDILGLWSTTQEDSA